MNKLFPPMYSRPKKGMLFIMAVYGLFAFLVIPIGWMPLFGVGLWETPTWIAWLEIAYHVINAAVMGALIADCLKDGWFMMSLDWRGSLKHVGLTIGLMLAVLVQQIAFLFPWGVPVGFSLETLPVVEMSVSLTPGYFAASRPVWATASMVLCSPIAVCGLFYALGFAPLCVKDKPVLAYINVALITAVPAIIDILCRQQADYVVIEYLMKLPAHLIACWSYQKTDNIWTPLLSLAAVNLICSLANILLL